MAGEILNKLNKLSEKIKSKISQESFLAKVDQLEERYGIKAVLILLDLLLDEIDFSDLGQFLMEEYGFNQFLAAQIKSEFGALIEFLAAEAEEIAAKEIEISSSAQNIEKEPAIEAIVAPPAHGVVSDAGLIFSAADEAEINKFSAASAAKKVPNYTLDAERILAGFIARPKEPDLSRRLASVVVSRIRGLRDDLEIKEILTKGTDVGGIGLSAEAADSLIRLIRTGGSPTGGNDISAKSRQIKGGSEIISEAKEAKDRFEPAIDLDFGEPEEANDEEDMISGSAPSAEAGKEELRIEMRDGLPVVMAPAQDHKLSESQKNGRIHTAGNTDLPAASPVPFIAKKSIPLSVLNAKTAGRPNLDDIKIHRKLSGPIEELSNMTLIEFRRLSSQPKAAAQKISAMIELLGQESFDKKHQGIAAWQKSEVSVFYRLLGQAAMNDGTSIEETIKDRLVAGKPTLTLDEFNAVMELNHRLRY